MANHESAKLKWSLYINIIHEEEEGFGGGGERGKEDKVERKKDEVQKKRQGEDKKEMECVMEFVLYMSMVHGLQVRKSQHTSTAFREK